MADGELKRRLNYQIQQDNQASDNNSTGSNTFEQASKDEERILHEAYQYLIREFEGRKEMEQVRLSYLDDVRYNLNS